MQERKPVIYRLFTNTAFHVLLAIIAGILLGHYDPGTGVKMEIVGQTFVNIIKVFIGPIIFLTIVLGISRVGDLTKVGRIGIKALVYFEVVTTFALLLGLIVAYVVRPGDIDIAGLTAKDASKYTSQAGSFSWSNFLLTNFTLQVLIVALVTGVAPEFFKNKGNGW